MDFSYLGYVLICQVMAVDLALTASRARCPTLTLPNGRVRIRSRGRTIQFRCKRGFTRVGPKIAICQRSNQWSQKTPLCVGSGCPKLDLPPTMIATKLYGGGMLRFTCASDYTREGPESIYCNGKEWNSEPPTCIKGMSLGCDFEKQGLCGWSQVMEGDNMDWIRHKGATPTKDTGPQVDHTLGTAEGHYLFIETSAPAKRGHSAKLMSPKYAPKDVVGVCMDFFYHMFGPNRYDGVGILEVWLKPSSVPLDKLATDDDVISLFRMDGNQGDEWHRQEIEIPQSAESFQFVFEAKKRNSWSSDIAIDDIMLYNCTNNSTTIITSPTERPDTIPTTTTTTTDAQPETTKAKRQTTTATPTSSPDTTRRRLTTSTTTTTRQPTTKRRIRTTTTTSQPTTRRRRTTSTTSQPTTRRRRTTSTTSQPTTKRRRTTTTPSITQWVRKQSTTMPWSRFRTNTPWMRRRSTTISPQTWTRRRTTTTTLKPFTMRRKTTSTATPLVLTRGRTTTTLFSQIWTRQRTTTTTAEEQNNLTKRTSESNRERSSTPTTMSALSPLFHPLHTAPSIQPKLSPMPPLPSISVKTTAQTLEQRTWQTSEARTETNELISTNGNTSDKTNDTYNGGGVGVGKSKERPNSSASPSQQLIPLIAGVAAAVVLVAIVVAVLAYKWSKKQRMKEEKEMDDQMNIISDYVETSLSR